MPNSRRHLKRDRLIIGIPQGSERGAGGAELSDCSREASKGDEQIVAEFEF